MKYFNEKEFKCNCGKCGLGFSNMDKGFINSLEQAREYAGVAFVLTSAMRCKAYNRSPAVGSTDSSSHLLGYAVDIACNTSIDRFKIIDSLIEAGFCRIGVNANFIHVDNDPDKPKKVIWMY